MTGPREELPDRTTTLLAAVKSEWDAPQAPAWLTTSLTAEFRRRHGRLGPKRELTLGVLEDTRRGIPVGARGVADLTEAFTLVLRAHDHQCGADVDVVVDVLDRGHELCIDGLVLLPGGSTHAFRAQVIDEDGRVVEALDTDAHGRFSLRGLGGRGHQLVLDDGELVLRGSLDLRRAW